MILYIKDSRLVLAACALVAAAGLLQRAVAFSPGRVQPHELRRSTSSSPLCATGGWGIGPQRELKPEEFAKSGDRRAFEGYNLRERGEFMREVARDKNTMLNKGAMDELLGVAASAGIRVKNPAERLGKFNNDGSSTIDLEENDPLDLSVQWEDDDAPSIASSNLPSEATKSKRTRDAESITRLDEDTGALGVW